MMDKLLVFINELWSRLWIKVTICVTVVVLVLSLIGGFSYFSKSAFLNRYLEARQEEGMTFEDLKPYLVWADTKELITMDEAKYATFNRIDNQKELEATKQSLLEANQEDSYYLVRVGRIFGIFPNYRVAVRPISLTLHTNLDKAELLLNGKIVARADSTDYSKIIERLPMADYTASIKGVYEGNPYQVERTFDGTQTTLDLSVSFKTFTVTSNLEGASLYVGEKEVGKINQNKYIFKNYPWADDVELFVKKSFKDGDLESNKIALSSIQDNSEVGLNIDGLLSEDSASNLVLTAFNQAWAYGTYGTDPGKTELTTVFHSGADNDFYKALKDSVRSKMQTDSRRASSLAISNVYLTSFSQIGRESYAVEYSAIYDFYYDKATDTLGKTQGNLYQTVGGRAIISKSDGNYLFAKNGHSVVTVLSEDNQVKKVSSVPETMIGTWTGTLSDKKSKVKMVVTAEGKVTTTIDYDKATASQSKTQSSSSTVTSYTDLGSGLYRLEASDSVALIPGAALGGVGVQYAYGVEISGNMLKPVVWQAATGTEFDYSKAMYGITLTKTAE